MKRYKVEGNKCYIYIHERLFDVIVFRSQEEAEAFKNKQIQDELRWNLPY